MRLSRYFPQNCHSFSNGRLGLVQFALIAEHQPEVIERLGHLRIFVARKLTAQRQRMAGQGFGLSQLVWPAADGAAEQVHCIGQAFVVSVGKFPLDR